MTISPALVYNGYRLKPSPRACTYTHTHTDIHILVYTYTVLKQAIDARIKQLKPKGEWEQEKPEE